MVVKKGVLKSCGLQCNNNKKKFLTWLFWIFCRKILNQGNFSDDCKKGAQSRQSRDSQAEMVPCSQCSSDPFVQNWQCLCCSGLSLSCAHILDVSRSSPPCQFEVNTSRASSSPCGCCNHAHRVHRKAFGCLKQFHTWNRSQNYCTYIMHFQQCLNEKFRNHFT